MTDLADALNQYRRPNGQFGPQPAAESTLMLPSGSRAPIGDGDLALARVREPLADIVAATTGGRAVTDQTPATRRMIALLEEARLDYEDGGLADSATFAFRLRGIAADVAPEAVREMHSYSQEYVVDELHRVADEADGIIHPDIACARCLCGGEVLVGIEAETNGSITEICGRCDGRGTIPAAAYDALIEDRLRRRAESATRDRPASRDLDWLPPSPAVRHSLSSDLPF